MVSLLLLLHAVKISIKAVIQRVIFFIDCLFKVKVELH